MITDTRLHTFSRTIIIWIFFPRILTLSICFFFENVIAVFRLFNTFCAPILFANTFFFCLLFSGDGYCFSMFRDLRMCKVRSDKTKRYYHCKLSLHQKESIEFGPDNVHCRLDSEDVRVFCIQERLCSNQKQKNTK